MGQPLLLDIITFLTTKNVVIGDGVDAFRDFIPEEPDTLIALIEYRGDPMIPVDPTAHRSVQVSTRNKDADLARQKALEIFKVFVDNQDETGRIDLTESRWGQLYLRQPPFRYKTDENNRAYYCFNIGITTNIE
jgi:hypothetical protein